MQIIAQILYNIIVINLNLMIFNLLPLPPLDGYKVVKNILLGKWQGKLLNFFWFVERFGFILIVMVLASGLLDLSLIHILRTQNRKDFSVEPPGTTMLDVLKDAGYTVAGVGKIEDIFANRGLTTSNHTTNNADSIPVSYTHLDVYKRQLYARPIVVPGHSVVTLTVQRTRNGAQVTADDFQRIPVEQGSSIRIQRAPHALQFLRLQPSDFYQQLRCKLTQWSCPNLPK